MSYRKIGKNHTVCAFHDDKDGETLEELAKRLSLEVATVKKLKMVIFEVFKEAEAFHNSYQQAMYG